MSLTPDTLAGIVELFGALTDAELCDACAEVDFRHEGETRPDEEYLQEIETALESNHLARIDESDTLLIAGPAAFPRVPSGGDDLPHILPIEPRTVDRSSAAERIIAELQHELEENPEPARQESIIDLCYDIESWAGIDTSHIREQLDP